MPRSLDVLRIQPEGGVRWVGSVENMEEAKLLIKTASARETGDFLVVNIETGDKIEIRADPAA